MTNPIIHPNPTDAALAAEFAPDIASIGGPNYTMAKVWADLVRVPNIGSRISFIHHTTQNNAHPNQAKVQRLMGVVYEQEMLVSYLAKRLAPCLGTVQSAPIMVGATDPNEALTFGGRTLPNLKPTALRDTLVNSVGPLAQLRSMRDQDLNRMNALIKETGNKSQKAYLDRLATSQTEARSIAQNLLSILGQITNDSPEGQILAATALVAMKVSPVITIHLPFGNDNHTDPTLLREATETVESVSPLGARKTGIPFLMTKLTDLNIRDQTTFLLMNVFGRTLTKNANRGRDHWANHHVTVVIGKPVRPSVIGGLAIPAGSNEYAATAIDSIKGTSDPNGDIKPDDSLASVGKTIGALAGLPVATLDTDIMQGKLIKAALA